MAYLKAADKETEISINGEVISIGSLYKRQIKTFNEWWSSKYNKFKNEGKILFDSLPDNNSRKKMKYIATMDLKDYNEFFKEYTNLIEELTSVIPEQYRYAFSLRKKFKFLNTTSLSLSISEAYTIIGKGLNFEEIKILANKDKIEQYRFADKKFMTEEQKVLMKEIEEEFPNIHEEMIQVGTLVVVNTKTELDDILCKNKLYDIKVKSAKRYQINYFDIDKNKSCCTNLNDSIFVPVGVIYSPSKQQKSRSSKKIPLTTIFVDNKPVDVFESSCSR